MTKKSNKISTDWIRETRDDFKAFLEETDFPDPERIEERRQRWISHAHDQHCDHQNDS